jgi:threonine synthase
MHYKSTRGSPECDGRTFEQVLLSSYADDGGMWIPEHIPTISKETLINWARLSFDELCAEVVSMYVDIDVKILREMTKKAFEGFNNGQYPPLPLKKFGDLYLLDASLGPTLRM